MKPPPRRTRSGPSYRQIRRGRTSAQGFREPPSGTDLETRHTSQSESWRTSAQVPRRVSVKPLERTDCCEEPQRPHGEQHVGRYLFLFWKVVVQSSWKVWFVNLGIWSVRRPRAWRRGLMQPMWLVVFLHLSPPASGVQIHKSTEPIVRTLKPLFSRGDRWVGRMECTSL